MTQLIAVLSHLSVGKICTSCHVHCFQQRSLSGMGSFGLSVVSGRRDAKEACVWDSLCLGIVSICITALAWPPCSSSPGPLFSVVSGWMGDDGMWQGWHVGYSLGVEWGCRTGICSDIHFLSTSHRENVSSLFLASGLLSECDSFRTGRTQPSCSHD